MSEADAEGETLSLSDLAQSIKRHDSALEALKDIPGMLKHLTTVIQGSPDDETSNSEEIETDTLLNPDD